MSQPVEQFGKYILLERIAAGGMAEVYLSKSTGAVGVNKFVAIKRILPQYSDHQEFIEMFKEEAKIAVNLNHGNVVSIYDFGVERSQFFLVMEFVEGKNLRQILNELKRSDTQFSVSQIIYLMKEVAAGLDHAHRCIDGTTGRPLNIVHRDMSPQNIMVSFEGEVKIIDFGIAKAENQLEATKAGTLKGKYGYMSPEQADGQNIDPRTDIFSIGIVLWELLANDRLFTSNNEAAILRKIRECQIPSIRKINPSVPQELELIVNKALAKDKSLRYQTAAALHRDLNLFINTHYPDFSTQDFSAFMKNTFSHAFLDQRRKMVEFSKLKSTAADEKTVVTNDIKAPPTPTGFADAKTMIDPRGYDNVDDPDLLSFDTSKNVKVSLDNLNDKKSPKNPRGSATLSGATQPGKIRTHTGLSSNTSAGTRSGVRTGTGLHGLPPNRRNPSTSLNLESVTGFFMKVAIALCLAGGGLYGYENYYLKGQKSKPTRQLQGDANSTNQPQLPPITNTVGETEMAASAPEYTVTFYSHPSGARVILDGEDTGSYTPYRKTVKANTPYSLRLVKEGYSDLITTITPTYEAYSFNGTLVRLPKVGSVVINIVNGGANPELLISGVPVNIKGGGDAYLIRAGVKIKILARNKTTGLSAEETVSVPANQRRIVDLYLK